MSKQYNLSTTEDNGHSVTTSQTVTEHPEEILRLMKLAGLENAQVVAEDDSEFEPSPANDKLDLDDYSKKSPESIAKQKKTIQPSLGDNPLEYSLDENEIQEALTKDFDEMEEGWGLDLVKGIGKFGKRGLKRLSRLGSKNTKDKYDGKGGFIGTDTTWNEDTNEDDDYMLKRTDGEYDKDEVRKMQYQQNVSDPLNRDIEASEKAITIEVDYDLELDKKKNNPLLKRHYQLMKKFNVFISMPEWQEGPPDSGFGAWTAKVRGSKENLIGWLEAWDYGYDAEDLKDMGLGESTVEVTEELTAGQKKLPDALQKSILAKQGKKDETKETKETSVEENLKEAEEQIKALKEDCSCGHGSSCDCGPDCGCGCNAVNEDENFDEDSLPSVDRPHVNGSQETEEIEQIIRAYWDELPEQLALDLGMHFDSLKGEFDEDQERLAHLAGIQERGNPHLDYDEEGDEDLSSERLPRVNSGELEMPDLGDVHRKETEVETDKHFFSRLGQALGGDFKYIDGGAEFTKKLSPFGKNYD